MLTPPETGAYHLLKFILKRLLLFIPVLFGVLFIVFTINYFTPGDPVVAVIGIEHTQEQYDAMKAELGLDKPYLVQFFDYVKGVVTEFDLGTSYTNKRPVSEQILERMPLTLKLGTIGIVIAVVLGIPFGIISATKQYSFVDYSVTIFSLFFASMPNFWLALMLIMIFSLKLGWFPATGAATWRGWILPCVTLGLAPISTIARQTRSSMLEVIRQDYITTARAKGQTEHKIIWKHALGNAMIPIITVVGFMVSTIVGGSVIIENIFNFPGLGALMMSAVTNKDYPMIQGTVLVISVFVCVINLLVDIIYGLVDPRIRAQYLSAGKHKKKGKGVTV